MISKVVQGEVTDVRTKENSVEIEEKQCKSKAESVTEKVTLGNVTDIVSQLLNATSKKGKSIIRLEIEIQNDS